MGPKTHHLLDNIISRVKTINSPRPQACWEHLVQLYPGCDHSSSSGWVANFASETKNSMKRIGLFSIKNAVHAPDDAYPKFPLLLSQLKHTHSPAGNFLPVIFLNYSHLQVSWPLKDLWCPPANGGLGKLFKCWRRFKFHQIFGYGNENWIFRSQKIAKYF